MEKASQDAARTSSEDFNDLIDRPDLSARVDAVERLTRLFRMERMVHLGVTCVSLIMLLASAGMLMWNGKAGPAELTGLFGSSGLTTLFGRSSACHVEPGTSTVGNSPRGDQTLNTFLEPRLEQLGKASRRAVFRSLLGFLAVLAAFGYRTFNSIGWRNSVLR